MTKAGNKSSQDIIAVDFFVFRHFGVKKKLIGKNIKKIYKIVSSFAIYDGNYIKSDANKQINTKGSRKIRRTVKR